MMNDRRQDSAFLEARILHTAHIVDKNLATAPDSRQRLLTRYGEELRGLLAEWARAAFEPNARIEWAQEVFEELTTGRSRTRSPQEEGTRVDIMPVVRSRRSVRRWADKPVGNELIRKLLEAARWAPSSGNRQPVRLIVVRSDVCKDAATQLKEPFLRRAPVVILVGVDLRVYAARERRTLPYLDAAAAIQNMLLVAHAEGLGCVWSKLDEEDWQFRPHLYFEMKRRLRLPRSFLPVTVIGAGWPAGPTRTPPRHDIDAFVRFDDQGFPQDAYPEWRPPYLRLYAGKVKHRLLRLMNSIVGKRRSH